MNRGQTFLMAAVFLGVCVAAKGQQNPDISSLIEQLVFDHPKASETPLYSPMKGVNDDDPEYARQWEKSRQAFRKLTELGERAFPLLMEHLEDQRASVHFRNHYSGHSVGDACYWNIYLQLTDHPAGYSSYGEGRKGRDGKKHT